MAQYARPSADTVNSTWASSAGGSLFESIDEASQSDADYILSQANASSAVFVTKLSAVNDPASSSGHVLRYTYRRSITNKNGTLIVQLRQGYVDEGSIGTLIRTDEYINPGNTFVVCGGGSGITLSSGEADTITDYGDLYIRFLVTANAGGGLTLQSSWAELEVPNSSSSTLVVQDASCQPSSDAISIVQTHNIALQDSSCDCFVDSISITQTHNLTVQDTHCDCFTDSISVTQTYNLSVQDAYCDSYADSISITQLHILVVQDTYSDCFADSVIIASGGVDLVVQDAYCDCFADSVLAYPVQYMRPASDTYDGSWTNQDGNNTNLYDSINEESYNDTDYIQSELSPSASVVVIKLQNMPDPGVSYGHTLVIRYARIGVESPRSIVTQLRQDYVDEGTIGTLIAEWSDADVDPTLEIVRLSLTDLQADTITDYSSLFIRSVAG